MAILVIDVTWQVVTRFILKNPSSWSEELATYLMVWVGLLGAAVALNRRAHLGINYFVDKFTERNRLFADIFVFLCIAFFAIAVMIIGGVALVKETFLLGQVAPAMGIKIGYVYLAIPISGFFISLYSIEFMIEKIIVLTRLKPGRPTVNAETGQPETSEK